MGSGMLGSTSRDAEGWRAGNPTEWLGSCPPPASRLPPPASRLPPPASRPAFQRSAASRGIWRFAIAQRCGWARRFGRKTWMPQRGPTGNQHCGVSAHVRGHERTRRLSGRCFHWRTLFVHQFPEFARLAPKKPPSIDHRPDSPSSCRASSASSPRRLPAVATPARQARPQGSSPVPSTRSMTQRNRRLCIRALHHQTSTGIYGGKNGEI